jgi:hypothetical protein
LRYDREVIAQRVRASIHASIRRSVIVALAAACVCAASPARAATVPSGAVIRTDRTVDVATFSRFIEARFSVVLRRVIAADIDRDGDLDILAATDRGFEIWLNDGAGRLTSQSAKHKAAVEGQTPADTWRDDEARDEETVQNELPSPRAVTEHAHAPPLPVRQLAPASSVALHSDCSRGTRAPRAPPSPL